MLNRSWAASLLLTALLATGAATSVAAPVTVDFELAPPLTVIGPTQAETSYLEAGARFTPSGSDALIDPSFCALGVESCIRNNASTYLTALNGAEVTITADRWFALGAFEAAFFPLPTPPGLFSGLNFGLRLSGLLWGGGSVEQVVALTEDAGNPGDFVFSLYAGAADLTLLRSLTLGACFFDGADCVRGGAAFDAAGLQFNDLQFAIDNLAISVPEPSAAGLVLLSLAALAWSRRRGPRRLTGN